MSKKDDHINYALKEKTTYNQWDAIRFIPHSLPTVSTFEVSLKTKYLGREFPNPIYINAMTGGSQKAFEINQKLAMIAKRYGLAIASGSVSIALKDPSCAESFKIIRKTYPEGFIFANIGASAPVKNGLKALQIMDADALQIHLNAPQEIVMPEGDRDFSFWRENVKRIAESVNVPVVVKEVGFGMSLDTMETLKSLEIKNIDVSGKSGTNFIRIENQRREYPLKGFDDYGFTTVESLLEARKTDDLTVFASGGFERPMDIVKGLALGAKAIGMSGYFLKRVVEKELSEIYQEFDSFIEDIRKIMAILSCKTIDDLTKKPLLFNQELTHFMNSRKISR